MTYMTLHVDGEEWTDSKVSVSWILGILRTKDVLEGDDEMGRRI
jgi:hypothetical protein